MIPNSLIFNNGNKLDFIVFNPKKIEFQEIDPVIEEIELINSDFWNKIKSIIWSSNCKFGFVVDDYHIIILNCYDNKAFKSNTSSKVFSEFFEAYKR